MTPSRGRDWVALILALGIATAINLVTVGVLIDALRSSGPGLSDNATQVITTGFGGMIGVLGSYIGFRFGQASKDAKEAEPDERQTPPVPGGKRRTGGA